MKKNLVKNVLVACMLAVALTGCGNNGTNEAPTDNETENTEVIEEQTSETEEDTIEETEENTEENTEVTVTVEDEEIIEEESWPSVYESSYYGDVVAFSTESNEFTDLIDYDGDKISLVADFDNDGADEAIVCTVDYDGDSSEYNGYIEDTYYSTIDGYYIEDDMTFKSVDIFSDVSFSILEHQYFIKTDDATFITLNGYKGTTPVGEILSVENDTIANVTDTMWPNGHKFFTAENEIVWISYSYSSVDFVEGESFAESFASGKGIFACLVPYYYVVNGTNVAPYDAAAKTAEEVNEIATFETDKYEDADAVQYIFRENGELDVTYAEITEYDVFFRSDIYYLEDGSWVQKNSINGLFYVAPASDESEWEFLIKQN